jgi:pilus assembly protein Flp/PilA
MPTERTRSQNRFKTFLHDERATTAIEYALIASVISMAIIGTVNSTGSALVSNFYDKITAAFDEVAQN